MTSQTIAAKALLALELLQILLHGTDACYAAARQQGWSYCIERSAAEDLAMKACLHYLR